MVNIRALEQKRSESKSQHGAGYKDSESDNIERDIKTLKAEYIKIASHDIKSAAASAKEGINILKDKISGNLNGDQMKILKIINNSLEKIVQIADELSASGK